MSLYVPIITTYLLTFLLATVGGVIYRFRGGWPDIPRPFEQIAFSSIYGWILYLAGTALVPALWAFSFSVLGVILGHGHTMNYKSKVDPKGLEKYEIFTKGLIGKVPDYWYKVIAHGFGGFLVTLPIGLCLLFINPLAALVVAPSGFLKSVAYMISWKLHPNYNDGKIKYSIGKFKLDTSIAIGEFLTGVFLWGVAALVILEVL